MSENDDEVTVLTAYLRLQSAVLRNAEVWSIKGMAALLIDAADALERLTAEAAQIKADRNRLVEEWAKDGRVLDRALAAVAERDALPEKIAQAEPFVAGVVRDVIHETPLTKCNVWSDTCPDWPLAHKIAREIVAEVARSFGAATPGEPS